MHWAATAGTRDVAGGCCARAAPDAIAASARGPTHSAAGAGRADVLLLLAEGGADACRGALRRGDRARRVGAAGAKAKPTAKSVSRRTARGWRRAFDLGARVGKLRADAGEDANPKAMDLKTCREVCSWRGWRRARSRRSASSSTRRAST